MRLVDTHMHLWDLTNSYPWLEKAEPALTRMVGDYAALRRNFLLPDYLALSKRHEVEKAVHVQALGFPHDPVAESQWLQKIADQHGYPHAIIGYANLADPEVERVLEGHAQAPNARGIRMPLNFHGEVWRRMADRGDYMSDLQWRRGYAALAQFGLLFEAQIYAHQLLDAAELALAIPEVTMVIEHLGWPIDLSERGFDLWSEGMEAVARCPNTRIKVSGIGTVFGREGAGRWVRTAIDLFGPDRSMFGSNFPPDSLQLSFDQVVDLVDQQLQEEERDPLFRTTAYRVYSL